MLADMSEQRLIELETRIAFQEETIRVLNEAVTCQQMQLDQVERRLRQLMERIKAQGEGGPGNAPANEVPPHY